jgi:hypothetical protein
MGGVLPVARGREHAGSANEGRDTGQPTADRCGPLLQVLTRVDQLLTEERRFQDLQTIGPRREPIEVSGGVELDHPFEG